MKKIAAIVAICAIVILHACSKHSSSLTNIAFTDPVQPVVVNANVAAGKTFTFTLGNSGTANIIKQAAHYQVSEAAPDENGSIIYRYTPAANFSGSDEVEIVYSEAAGGSASGCSGGTSGNPSAPTSSTHYAIKFNVAD